MTYDKTYGHVAYGCAECCGWADAPYMYYDPLGVVLGFQSGQDVWDDDLCTNQRRSILFAISPSSWTTGNSAIATASNAVLTGVAIGSTTNGASGSLTTGIGGGGGRKCPILPVNPSGQANVNPAITSISPSRGLIGATTSSVTINGKGFTGGHVNTPAAIQVNNITTFTDNQIVLDFVVSSTATPGNNAISVTASGQPSNEVNFFVQVPTSLSIVPGTNNQVAEFQCASNPCGAACGNYRTFTYQVNDQDSPPQPINAAGLAVWDSFGTTSPDPLNIDECGGYATTCTSAGKPNSGPCGVSTNASGQFLEGAVGACSAVCLSGGSCVTGGPSDVTQTWHVGFYTINQGIAIYCQKTLVNGQ